MIKNDLALKYRVRDFIKAGIIKFETNSDHYVLDILEKK